MPLCAMAVANISQESSMGKSGNLTGAARRPLTDAIYGQHLANSSLWNDTLQEINMNLTHTRTNSSREVISDGVMPLNELQLIKAIVLVVVITILLLSTCKLVFKTFSKYSVRKEDN